MEKKYRFLVSIFWLLCIVAIDAYNDKNHILPYPSIPNFQITFTQFEQEDSFDFLTPQNPEWISSSKDWYQQHRQFVLNHTVIVPLQGKMIKITPEDIHLINCICADNPHKDQDALRMQLSQSSAFNYAQHFFNGDQLLHPFTSDIFIDPVHFKKVSAADYRTERLQDAAKQAMYDRHKREKSKLESTQKVEVNTAKKLSKSEKKKVDNRHKQEWTALKSRQNEENKHQLGVKNKTIKKSSVVIPGQQKASSQILQSKIPVQNLQNLRAQNQFIKSNARVLQKIMEHRLKAIENSIKNQTSTVQSIQINPQTAGFLQAQGIDTQQFIQVEGLPIQHQLTQELVEVLNDVADFAMQHRHALYQTHLTEYCAHLASLTQQSNAQGALQQAIDGTNCCHGIQHYLIGMVSGIEQKYQQFQTALDYLQPTLEEYALLFEQHALQGAVFAYGLEAAITAGMIAAPTATAAVTGIMIGATVFTMAPLCAQAMIDTISFGGACITGDWNRVESDLDKFGKIISSPETVARMAEFTGGAVMSTPNLSNLIEQIVSLRPVITSVQNASGEIVESFYLMTKNQLQKVWLQSAELLQLPEFINFNATYKKVCGFNFFDILPKSHPAFIPAFAEGLEIGALNSAEQVALTSLFTQSQESLVGDIVKFEVSQVGSQLIENIVATDISKILEQEIVRISQPTILITDLTEPITAMQALEFANSSPQIRQLQDLAKYTDNFKNLENLIPEDIYYLNRIYELQTYRTEIKNFLDIHKPFFMYNDEQYFIEDIASYHIHAGDYYRKDSPKGGHSNYGGHKLDYFNLELIKNGPLGAKDVIFYNSRNIQLTKPSSLYPETWSEFICDLKAIEAMMNKQAIIKISENLKTLEIIGYTTEGLEIKIFYDIANKRIKSHYPDLENFQ